MSKASPTKKDAPKPIPVKATETISTPTSPATAAQGCLGWFGIPAGDTAKTAAKKEYDANQADFEQLHDPYEEIILSFNYLLSDAITDDQWAKSASWFRVSPARRDIANIFQVGVANYKSSPFMTPVLAATYIKRNIKIVHGIIENPDYINRVMGLHIQDILKGGAIQENMARKVRDTLDLKKGANRDILMGFSEVFNQIIKRNEQDISKEALASIMVAIGPEAIQNFIGNQLNHSGLDRWTTCWSIILSHPDKFLKDTNVPP